MELKTAQEVFENLNGGMFVGLDTETTVTLKGGKKNPLQGKVQKIMTGATVMSFANAKSNAYDNMVKRRLAAEGKDPESFVLSPRAWGERIAGTPFVAHKGEHYLEVIFLHAGRIEYKVGGKVVDPSEIDGLPDRQEGGQGGLDNRVQIRTFKLSSIKTLRAKGAEVG